MLERRAIAVSGIVQGVGFRPFVYGLASRLGLGGFVRNQTNGVCIEIEGDAPALDRFQRELAEHPPPLARIAAVSWERRPPCGDGPFRITPSDAVAAAAIFISPDVATCEHCLAELFDPADPRYRYPFLNCTNCGPRLSIVTGAPYDRERTTMARFALCPRCRREYEDPSNRRFHAQPTACGKCGPSLEARDAHGRLIETATPLTCFANALQSGQIGALKGLGGYHLACDARRAAAVAELRRRKHRDEKPFALMVRDDEAAARLCEVSAEERRLLTSPRRPIVLLRKRPGIAVAEEVAPGNPFLGIMLPYTPLHHLLVRDMQGMPLVMTSGNRSDEPIAYEDGDALKRLSGIADVFLLHNRPIHVRCDDSVTRWVGGAELPLRRSRGYAPEPLALPRDCPVPILALGGQLKGTFALGRGRHAFLSQHLGDLDHYDAYRAFERDIDLYERLFRIQPKVLAHDLHPDYASTRYAVERARTGAVRLIAVQHHHAHMASCMAEHGLDEPVMGVSFDGTGYGTDGAIWGGEFLVGDYRGFRRAAHLRYVGLPGGDRAIRKPWRMATAHLTDAGCSAVALERRISLVELSAVRQMLNRRFNTPPTSSAGRLFDAVACLTGIRDRVSYEGQAAIELEWLANGRQADGAYPIEIAEAAGEASQVIDTRPMIRAIVEDIRKGAEPAQVARRFHTTMVELIAAVCERIRGKMGLSTVVLSGGVFLNALLTAETCQRLSALGFRVYRHEKVPPSDGGLSLGQLAIAAAQTSV
jgi:hydrogenase maturation protein HypF